MADYSDLVKRLRGEMVHPQQPMSLLRLCADALEAQAKRIAELERMLQRQSDKLNVLSGSIAAYHAEVHESRITELKALVKALADDLAEYAPCGDDDNLVQSARAALGENDGN